MKKKRKRSALIVGLGRFGTAAANRLVALGWEVVGVDLNAEVVQGMRDRLHHVVQLDASDDVALGTVGVSDFEVCIVSRGTSMESSILLVLNLQQLGAVNIVAKAASDKHAQILQRLGVNQIVFPERDAGHHLAETLQSPHLVEWIDLSDNQELGAIRVPESRVGTRLKHWREIQRTPLRVLARLNAQGEPLPVDMDAQLGAGEVLVIVGPLHCILSMGR